MITVPRESRHFAQIRDRIPVPSPAYLAAMRRADADVYLQRGAAVLTATSRSTAGGPPPLRVHGRARLGLRPPPPARPTVPRRGLLLLRTAPRRPRYAQSDFQRRQLERHHEVASTVQRTVYPAAAGATAGQREHVLWVGRCLDWKRPMAFLDLAEGRPDLPFAMACPAYEGARALYNSVTERASRLPNVQFLGFVPFADTEGLFRHARVFVNSSTAEGFPNTFVQAARVGTPVLSLEVNPDGILQTSDFGACAGGDPALLARQLDRLLDDRQTWERQSANAYRYFQREHDIEALTPAFARSLLSLRS